MLQIAYIMNFDQTEISDGSAHRKEPEKKKPPFDGKARLWTSSLKWNSSSETAQPVRPGSLRRNVGKGKKGRACLFR